MPTLSSTPKLSSTQIGVIGENLLVNAVMKASNGQLSPFKSVADDDGLDVLFFDKKTGNAVAIQLKCRTATDGKRNTAQFDVRKATVRKERRAFLVAALLDETMTKFVWSWFISMEELPKVSKPNSKNYIITPSRAVNSEDKYVKLKYRCETKELAERIIDECKTQPKGKK